MKAIKDEAKKWLIRNILIPKINIFDYPGFVATRFTDKGKNIFLREIFIPEHILINIEKEILKEHAIKGKKILYSIGKKFGYRYASLSYFPTITKTSKKDFLWFADMTIKYIGSIWAKGIEYELNYDKKIITLEMEDFVVCSENGIGHILSEGGITGVWSFVMDDKNIEGAQTKCQGRENKKCKVICATKSFLDEQKIKYFEEPDLIVNESIKDYEVMNALRKTEYNTASFKDLLDSNIFKYNYGKVIINDERFFDFECGLFYLLEYEIMKISNGKNILFNTSFNFGKELYKKIEGEGEKFMSNLLSSLGWGDILITTKKGKYIVILNYFPWSVEYSSKIDFMIPKGIISGFLSAITGRKGLKLKTHETIITNDGMKLVLTE